MNWLFLRLVCLASVVAMAAACDSNPVDPDANRPQLGGIVGIVRYAENVDPIEGDRIEGARVSLTGPGGAREATSTFDGSFFFEELPAGVYTLAVSEDGLACTSVTVTVQAFEATEVDLSCVDAL
ncbi:MAG: carboxypeptidase-like regulatory domain-containing protein [Acidimicrobiia bacterium]